MQLKITTNAADVSAALTSLARSQIPFATSKAINDLALNAKKQEQAAISQYFTMRTPWLTKSGAMPVTLSNKKQVPNIHAILGIRDTVAALSATGGTKESKTQDMAVPLSKGSGYASTRERLNPARRTLGRAFYPGSLTRKRSVARGFAPSGSVPFYKKLSNGDSALVIRSLKRENALQVLYVFKRSVKIKQTWPLIDNVTSLVQNRYQVELSRRLSEAVDSAYKRKAKSAF